MSVASCGCDATFAGLAVCHCGKGHRSFADRPAYDAHRRLARPCLHPVLLGMKLLGDRGWGWAARDIRLTQDPVVRLTMVRDRRIARTIAGSGPAPYTGQVAFVAL